MPGRLRRMNDLTSLLSASSENIPDDGSTEFAGLSGNVESASSHSTHNAGAERPAAWARTG